MLHPQAYEALFCETSAKEGTNIVEAVLHLARCDAGGGGLSFEYFSLATSLRLIFPSFRREVKKNVKLRRQSDSEVKLSSSNPKKTFNGCCGL